MPAVFLTEPSAVPAGTAVARAEIGALLDVVTADNEVILVSVDPQGAAAARAARFATGNVQVGLLPLIAPPTLVFVLSAVAALVPDFAMGYLPNVFARTRHYTRTFAALGSVRGLAHPQPSRSMLRRAALGGGPYVVDWQTQSVTAGKTVTLPQHAWAVTASSANPPAVTRRGWPDQPVHLGSESSFWGASRWLEVTAVSQAPEAIIGSLFAFIPPDAVQCRSCARICGGQVCPFCQVRHDDHMPQDPSKLAMNGAG